VVALALGTFAAPTLGRGGDEFYNESAGLRDRWHIGVGYLVADFDTEIALDSRTLGKGTQIDLEDDLGFDRDVDDTHVYGWFRIRPRHKIELSWYRFDRSSRKVIQKEFQFGEEVFPADAELEATFDFDLLQLTYDWSFFRRGKWEAGLRAGVAYMETEAGFTAVDNINQVVVAREGTDEALPVPLLGIHFDYSPIQRLFLGGGVSYFSIDDLSGVSGDIIDANLRVRYYPWEHVGFTLSYNYQEIHVEEDEGELTLEVDYSWDGAFIGILFAW
jgi:hypothetical protein